MPSQLQFGRTIRPATLDDIVLINCASLIASRTTCRQSEHPIQADTIAKGRVITAKKAQGCQGANGLLTQEDVHSGTVE